MKSNYNGKEWFLTLPKQTVGGVSIFSEKIEFGVRDTEKKRIINVVDTM